MMNLMLEVRNYCFKFEEGEVMDNFGPFGLLLYSRIKKIMIMGNVSEGLSFLKKIIQFYIANILECKVNSFTDLN